jgi:hypothetical protein
MTDPSGIMCDMLGGAGFATECAESAPPRRDIRARWRGVVVCAKPRLGELGRGITIPWRVLAALITAQQRGLSNNGTASGDSELKAGLRRLRG